jgi:hypothetical protein
MCASEDVRSEKKHLWEEMFTLASGIQANMNQVLDFSKRGKKKKIEFQEDQRIHILCNGAIDDLRRIQEILEDFSHSRQW